MVDILNMKTGKIDISELNTLPEKHELATAKIFAALGKDVKFIRPSNIKGTHTPDFYMDGLEWEIKSPQGKTINCIEGAIKVAVRQSRNIIIDLRRLNLPVDKIIAKVKFEVKLHPRIKNILVITKEQKILTIKGKKYTI